MLDRIIVTVALLALVGFAGIVVVSVREPDLTVVIVLMVAFAIQDFWVSVLRPGARQPGTRDDIEERPNPVSGKPLAGPKQDYQPNR
ncbi:MAG: hypothetical protein K9G60_10505 [Pseudolabrys sp.]|nr:hypothetical protein [Pseudolabrys sp.]